MPEVLIYKKIVEQNNRIVLPSKAIELIDGSIFVEYDKKYLEFLIHEPVQLAIIRDFPFYFYNDFEDFFPNAIMSWSICNIDYFNHIYEVCDLWGAPFPHDVDGLTHRLSDKIFRDEDRFVRKSQRITLNTYTNFKDKKYSPNYEGSPALIVCEKGFCDVAIFNNPSDRDYVYQLTQKRTKNKN